jgi:methionyl-tRNA formyltransferase
MLTRPTDCREPCPLNIVFMGTPVFACASLEALLDMPEHTVVGVFTQPDRAAGRGMRLLPSPVKTLAAERNIPVFQPAKMRDGTAINQLRELQPDLVVVVAYGRMLPHEMLELPPLGCVNVHASLLPELRGAAPIQWAIARGLSKTGVTTQLMAEECDAGDILYQEAILIGEQEDASSLHDRLQNTGAALLQKTVRAIACGAVIPVPQNHEKATYAPILRKEDGVIDPSLSAVEIDRLIRAMNPWPGATLNGLKIHRACLTGDGTLKLLEVQTPGKKRMSAEEYFRGVQP